jgi:hypothetical protein
MEVAMRVPALVLSLTAAAMLVASPAAPASARGWHHGHGGGLLFGVGAAVGALVVGAATIATAPVRIIADAASGPAYAPAPAYAAAPPAYYAPQPQAYAPQPQAYYPPPQQAYYPPPQQAYYPPPQQAYYPPPAAAYYPPR